MFIISFSIYYNLKWSYFYLRSLLLLCTFKFHRTVSQLNCLNFLFIHSRLQLPKPFDKKKMLQVIVDKNSFFCRSWKSFPFLQRRVVVIIKGKEHSQFSFILSKKQICGFFRKTKIVTNTYCFATVTYIHRFRCVWIFLVWIQIKLEIAYLLVKKIKYGYLKFQSSNAHVIWIIV